MILCHLDIQTSAGSGQFVTIQLSHCLVSLGPLAEPDEGYALVLPQLVLQQLLGQYVAKGSK